MKWTWTNEDTEEGRKLLSNAFDDPSEETLNLFFAWVNENIAVNMPVVEDVFDKAHQVGNKDRAFKLYLALIPPNNNPIPQNLVFLLYEYGYVSAICASVLLSVAWLLFG